MYRWQKVVEMCKENNRFAQNRLYEAFSGRMFRLCMRYVRQREEAEEIVMNGFLKFFRGLSEFDYRDDTGLEGWLKRIMVNEALMHLRRQKALPVFTDTDEAEVPDSVYLPDGAVNAETIYAAILELPTGYRTVFNLYVVEGYTHEEIAKQLNVSVGTSKSQLSKARALLQQLLKQRGYEQYGTI
ncbi:MAG: sigma-70 family RNA polymerase sigma factor [Spirosomataceae bacterium]